LIIGVPNNIDYILLLHLDNFFEFIDFLT